MTLTIDPVVPPGPTADDESPRRAGRPSGGGAASDRAARSLAGLSDLLTARPELRGVHAPADLAYEAVRWSA